MTKSKKERYKVALAFVILLILSILSDVTQQSVIKEGAIERAEIGGKKEEIVLQLEVDGNQKDYVIEILPAQPTKEEADKFFEMVIAEIDREVRIMKDQVPIRDTYLNGVVEAKWTILPRGYLDASGGIRYEKLTEEGQLMQASVYLECGKYEKIYNFSFMLMPRELSQDEKDMHQLEQYVLEQMQIEGSTQVALPTQLDNRSLKWSYKKEYKTPQVFLLEVISLVLLSLMAKEKQKKDEQKRIAQMEREYPDIVNQLSFLLGAGMTIRQAWNRISVQYAYKKKEKMMGENSVYEAVLRLNRRFSEGESERRIYQQFVQEIPAPSYRKLMRMLLGSTQKGMLGLCERLEEECRMAYEQRVVQAKKLGEEASAKMLLPLMLMLAVVMGIVILPALIGFQM